MILIDSIKTFGSYLMLMKRVLVRPERFKMFLRRTLHEIYQLGIDSIPIVLIISLFIGAVLCIQMKTNVESPWMPKFVTGYATREVLLLEFSSTIMCLILAGKVGSNITSEIGAMRVTQQIDALDMMGVNSANFLILPKITGLVFMIPMLVIFSIAAGIGGAFLIGKLTHLMTAEDLTIGLQHEFTAWFIYYSIIKSLFFAFIITSVASFYGYTVKGGSIEVGKASTNAVVSCSVLILFSDIVLTNIMMQ
jgi:phospholipid/cholesterol/gamma-HCH transport system permease protein